MLTKLAPTLAAGAITAALSSVGAYADAFLAALVFVACAARFLGRAR